MRDFGTGTDFVIVIVGVVPVDLELVVVPVAVRHVAIRVTRARYLPDFIHVTDNFM